MDSLIQTDPLRRLFPIFQTVENGATLVALRKHSECAYEAFDACLMDNISRNLP